MAEETRKCKGCGYVGPGEMFGKNGQGARFNRCKPCVAAYQLAYQRLPRNREKQAGLRRSEKGRARVWRARLKRYGITPERYAELLAGQGGVCAICGNPPTLEVMRNGVQRNKLNVDHDHTTGAVRGLLCPHCNKGVGYFKDDPDLLSAACRYVAAGNAISFQQKARQWFARGAA